MSDTTLRSGGRTWREEGRDTARTASSMMPTPAPAPSQTPTAAPRGEMIRARISHYWPALGGPNCSNFVNGECLSRMASGKNWANYVDRALACPSEYPFGTKFVIFGKVWECWDRGGAIVRQGNVIWLDLLTQRAPVPFGTEMEVQVLR